MKSALLVLLMLLPRAQVVDYVVITATQTPVDQLSRFQLKQIYFGKLDRLANTRLQPLQLKESDALRLHFDREILGEKADIQDYWLQQKLKGEAQPPLTVGDWALVAAYVRRNPGYIGYIPADRLGNLQGLKVIQIRGRRR